MTDPTQSANQTDVFRSADWYDRSINWSARLGRELPVLMEVFGPPGAGGLIDAGCGTGRQARALSERGYRVVGADASEDMLAVARRPAQSASPPVEFVLTPFATMYETLGGGFDGVYCLGNSLAAAGTRDEVGVAVTQFARCLRPGGRLFIQVLNFAVMRLESPCVRGPRVSVVDGREYLSVRQYQFLEDRVEVTNITLWQDHGWQKRIGGGRLYPVELDELGTFCEKAGLHIDQTWGKYAREPFDRSSSMDLLIAATRA